MRSSVLLSLLALGVESVVSQQTAWGQCGGINWVSPTTCVAGYYCLYSNPCKQLYYQS